MSIADPLSSSKVVLLDSLITNIDRTPKNTNLLNWNKELWLIDHGASLYFHHNWNNWKGYEYKSFPMIKDHVLLERATEISVAAEEMKKVLQPHLVGHIVSLIPDDWLVDESSSLTSDEKRKAYTEFLNIRISHIDQIAKEVADA